METNTSDESLKEGTEAVKEETLEKEAKEEESSELGPEQKLEKELEEFKQKYYYLAAEMENARKRFEREKTQIVKFGSESILKDIVSVVDTFELTLNALKADEDEKMKNVCVGLEMIRKQFLETLKGHGLEKIDSLEKPFDPNFHEAMSKEQSDKHEEMTVIKEHQSGYTLNGRVLRASKVIVSTK